MFLHCRPQAMTSRPPLKLGAVTDLHNRAAPWIRNVNSTLICMANSMLPWKSAAPSEVVSVKEPAVPKHKAYMPAHAGAQSERRHMGLAL